MAYATIDDLKARLGSRYSTFFGVSETTNAQEDLSLAEGEVILHLQARVQLPVTDDQLLLVLKNFVLTLAEDLIYSRSQNAELSKRIQSRVAAVRQSLAKIASGELKLQGVSEATDKASESVVVKGDSPVFTKDNMAGF